MRQAIPEEPGTPELLPQLSAFSWHHVIPKLAREDRKRCYQLILDLTLRELLPLGFRELDLAARLDTVNKEEGGGSSHLDIREESTDGVSHRVLIRMAEDRKGAIPNSGERTRGVSARS